MDYTQFWQHADALTRTLFFVLLAMSIASWLAFLMRLLDTHRLRAVVLHAHAVQKSSGEGRQALLEQSLLQQMGQIRLRSEQWLAVMGTVAALAPFVGLFGTVWGIFHALRAIGLSGQAGLGQVAGPVGEALIMTGVGLAVAIPAVLFFNVCVRQNRRLMLQMQDQAHGLMIAHATQPAVMSVGSGVATIDRGPAATPTEVA